MITVYVIQSIEFPEKLYVGQTKNLDVRLSEHNKGKSTYTSTWKPWKVIHTEFLSDRTEARVREVYLKSTAGKKFLRKQGLI